MSIIRRQGKLPAPATSRIADAHPAASVATDESYWGEIQRAFDLDRTVINLNNGGCSPAPTHVLEHMWRVLEPCVESALLASRRSCAYLYRARSGRNLRTVALAALANADPFSKPRMKHALMYHGAFEPNFSHLTSGATTFIGTDGNTHELRPWPADVDGLRIGYMEKEGKKFFAVRVMDSKADLVLPHEVRIDSTRHMGMNKRFGAEPTIVDEGPATDLLADILKANPELRMPLADIRARMR